MPAAVVRHPVMEGRPRVKVLFRLHSGRPVRRMWHRRGWPGAGDDQRLFRALLERPGYGHAWDSAPGSLDPGSWAGRRALVLCTYLEKEAASGFGEYRKERTGRTGASASGRRRRPESPGRPCPPRARVRLPCQDGMGRHRDDRSPLPSGPPVPEALEMMRQESARHFDPRLLEVFRCIADGSGETEVERWTGLSASRAPRTPPVGVA